MKERLKLIRKELGKTQIEMAELLGVGKATMQNYEYGKTKPSANALSKLKELGFNSNWLLYGTEGMYQSGFEISESSNFTPEFSRKFLYASFDKIISLYVKAGKILEDGFANSVVGEINQILIRAQTERETEIMLEHFLERITSKFKI
ncbi:MAG: helix-turn-helix domain-containing protein [Alphaproteobacteria bacterium]|nr:MAG: hypothetical protein B6I23_01700 [Rickettsiaceae bacterium 4572_127]